MRGPAARAAVLLPALLAVLGLAGGPALAAPAGNPYAAGRVVVVGVPGLTWRDVSAATPSLRDLTRSASAGALSVRAARSVTCLLDGWATLGAGNRARYPDDDAPTAGGPQPRCAAQEQVADGGLADPRAAVAAVTADDATRAFGAEAGALGRAVGCARVTGAAAEVAVAQPGVHLETGATAGPGNCPLTLVPFDALEGGAGTDPGPRAAALGRVDAQIGRLRAQLPARTLLLVVGVSEVDDDPAQLHVALASGPGFAAGRWLASASTGRAPYVQLIDVAPTVLRALGRPVPPSMNGQPMRPDGARPDLPGSLTELRRDSTAATVHHRSTGIFFWTTVLLGAAVVGLGVGTLGGAPGGRLPRPAGPGAGRLLRGFALVAASLPAATYLAGLLPWARAGDPRAALGGAVAVADVVVAALAGLGPWRRRPLGPPLAVLAVTEATLVGDVVTGSHLELDGPLGYDAVVAGRFTGYGNLTFGLLITGGLLLTAAVATAAARRVPPRSAGRTAAGVAVTLGLLVVGLDGAPMLGRDLGGVLAGLPGFLLLALLLARARVTPARVAAILGAAVVAVGALAVTDWLRPPDQRTHLGRFVQQVLTGEAWTVVSRKGQANLQILVHSPLAWMLPVLLAAGVWLVRPGGRLRLGPGREPGGLRRDDVAVLRSGLLGCALSLALGAAVNDSGVAVPAAAAGMLLPLLVWLAAAGDRDVPRGSAPTPSGGRAEHPGRVTVGSRGSTVWNA